MRRTPVLLILASALLLLGGCGDDAGLCPSPDGHCVTARFTLSDGTAFDFVGASSRPPEGSRWQISAADPDHQPYGISIIWDSTQVTAPGKHTPCVVGGAVDMWVTRPHPTDPKKVGSSTTQGGSLTFTTLAYSAGQVVAGTFEGLRLPRASPSDTVDVAISAGTFSALVK